jgi:hypothetical protein
MKLIFYPANFTGGAAALETEQRMAAAEQIGPWHYMCCECLRDLGPSWYPGSAAGRVMGLNEHCPHCRAQTPIVTILEYEGSLREYEDVQWAVDTLCRGAATPPFDATTVGRGTHLPASRRATAPAPSGAGSPTGEA